MSDIPTKGGLLHLFEIPKELNPKLPPIEQIKKDDSNHGIDKNWMKVCINYFNQNEWGVKHLPRIFWVMKSWTLKELHHQVLSYH